MGATVFRHHAARQGVDWSRVPVTPEDAVEAWRDKHPAIAGWRTGRLHDGHTLRQVGLWKSLEHAAHRAAERGESTDVGRTSWLRDGDDVVCLLPSGRRLIYPGARIEDVVQGGGKRRAFTYAHHKTRTQSVRRQARRERDAGRVSGPARRPLVRLEAAGIEVVLHVHDEVVAELPSRRPPRRDGGGHAKRRPRGPLTSLSQ